VSPYDVPSDPPVLLAQSAIESVGTPSLWAATIGAVIALLVLDFIVTRKPHEVSMKEAIGWSTFYIALPLAFGAYIWSRFGSQTGVEYLTGYLVEKSLSVDNLFVFMLLLSAFAVPAVLQQRVLLFGIVGALVLRGIFIALGAAALKNLSFAFLLFGGILLLTAVKILRDQRKGTGHEVDIDSMRSVRLLRRFMPVVSDYRGTKMFVRENGVRVATPLALVVWPSWPPTSCSRSTPCPPSTASPVTPTWSSPPTPSPCSGCARSTSCCRARCPSSCTWATAWPRSSASSASSWCCTGRTASGAGSRRSRRSPRSA
jgi:uncharacterized membrane protein YeaQ/YmgE (transglycosylase-associated protein family)